MSQNMKISIQHATFNMHLPVTQSEIELSQVEEEIISDIRERYKKEGVDGVMIFSVPEGLTEDQRAEVQTVTHNLLEGIYEKYLDSHEGQLVESDIAAAIREIAGIRRVFDIPLHILIHKTLHTVEDPNDCRQICLCIMCGEEGDFITMLEATEGGEEKHALRSIEAYVYVCALLKKEPKLM